MKNQSNKKDFLTQSLANPGDGELKKGKEMQIKDAGLVIASSPIAKGLYPALVGILLPSQLALDEDYPTAKVLVPFYLQHKEPNPLCWNTLDLPARDLIRITPRDAMEMLRDPIEADEVAAMNQGVLGLVGGLTIHGTRWGWHVLVPAIVGYHKKPTTMRMVRPHGLFNFSAGYKEGGAEFYECLMFRDKKGVSKMLGLARRQIRQYTRLYRAAYSCLPEW